VVRAKETLEFDPAAAGDGFGRTFRRRAARLGRAAAVVVRDPAEGVERVREKIANEGQRWTKANSVAPDPVWQASLHNLLGASWPCAACEGFDALWGTTVGRLEAEGLAIGRGSYSGWDDADPGLARAAFCLTHHRVPAVVVETGVARGFTTRMILEAMEAKGCGHLYSIDLPPPLDQRRLADETGAAVADSLRGRWTLIEGSSRRRLPGLLKDLGAIDLFVHDSRHTRRNIIFELQLVWPALRTGGFLLADDIHGNTAFEESVRAFGEPSSIVCASDDERGQFGLIRKSG
jgi:Methyltransferase domain